MRDASVKIRTLCRESPQWFLQFGSWRVNTRIVNSAQLAGCYEDAGTKLVWKKREKAKGRSIDDRSLLRMKVSHGGCLMSRQRSSMIRLSAKWRDEQSEGTAFCSRTSAVTDHDQDTTSEANRLGASLYVAESSESSNSVAAATCPR